MSKDVKIFSKAEFEAALPTAKATGQPLWIESDAVDGEFCYLIPVDRVAGITIRSSVKVGTGLSAGVGEDSIRAWLIELETGKPLGEKVARWTTRLEGWEGRLDGVIRTLWTWRLRGGDCPFCQHPLKVGKVKDQAKETYGRPYASCWNKNCKPAGKKAFFWLDVETDAARPPYFVTEVATPVETPPPAQKPNGLFSGLGNREEVPVDSGPVSEPMPLFVSPPAQPGIIHAMNYGDRTPNPPQRAAIEMPTEADVRIIAPAGSGKTTVIAYRIAYLVSQGINPANILAVTFSKTMADELYNRAVSVCPALIGTPAAQQICTIHALTKRLLAWHYGDNRDVAPDWEQKAAVETIAEALWPKAQLRPGYAEILQYINGAKSRGYPAGPDADYYIAAVGEYHGQKLAGARREFDAVMRKGGKKQNTKGFMTFADMVFEVENYLRTDPAFRYKWQNQFKYVIIDEGQDTSAQALRILLTLSFEPGVNRVYDHWQPGQTEVA